MESTNRVTYTKDLAKFKLISGNRPINPKHVDALIRSITERNLLEYAPIIVNAEFGIIEGQHRFKAAEYLGVGLYYLVVPDLSIKDVQILNKNQKAWTMSDYLKSYVSQGHEDYIAFDNLYQRHPFTVNSLLSVVSPSVSGGGQTKRFKSGLFKMPKITEAQERLDKLLDFAPYYRGYQRRDFVRAVKLMASVEKYDHDHMLDQLQIYGDRISHQIDVKGYLRVLEDVYNMNSKSRRLRFF